MVIKFFAGDNKIYAGGDKTFLLVMIKYMLVVIKFLLVVIKFLLEAHSLVLKVQQFIVDLLNVYLHPQDVVVAIDAVHHCIVETVQLLQQVQLFLDSTHVWIVSDGDSEQFLSVRIDLKLAPEVVESSLVGVESIASLSWRDTLHHWTFLQVDEQVHNRDTNILDMGFN